MIIDEDEYSVTIKDIPDYASYYMCYGERDGNLTDEDVKIIDNFMKENNLDHLVDVSEGTNFCSKPAFGLATSCYDYAVFMKSQRENITVPQSSLYGGYTEEENEIMKNIVEDAKRLLKNSGNTNPNDYEIREKVLTAKNRKKEDSPYRNFIYHCSYSDNNYTPKDWQNWFENKVTERINIGKDSSFIQNVAGEIDEYSDYWRAHIDSRPSHALIEMATLLKVYKENSDKNTEIKDPYYRNCFNNAADVLNEMKQFALRPEAFDYVINEYKKLDRQNNIFNNKAFEKENVENQDSKFRYMLLDRMKTDCDYYLGNGNKNPKVLWSGEETQHIKNMVSLYNSFPSHRKPEWLTIEKLDDYSMKLTGKSLEENNFMDSISKNYTEGILLNNSIKIAADICLSDTRNEPYFYGITHEGLRALKEDNDNIRNIVLKNIDTILNETDSSHNKTDVNLILDEMIDKWYYTNHPTQTAKEPGYISNIQHLDSEKEDGYANILGYNEILGMWGIYSKSENVFAPYNDYKDAKENFSLLESYDNTDSKEYKDLLKQRDYLKVSNLVFEKNVDSITNDKKQEIEKKLSDNINENEKKQILLHSESNAKEQIKECNNNINDNGNKGKRK